jgi:1,2-diacylglycerol 3-beta-glucosyltransferase
MTKSAKGNPMLLDAVGLFALALGLIYFITMMAAGLRVMARSKLPGHRRRTPARDRADHGRRRAARRGAVSPDSWWQNFQRAMSTPEGDVPHAVILEPADCVVYFLVPCLNERAVIQETVRGLLSDARARVVVVDDASEDDTGVLAAAVDADRVRVVRRELPFARRGKGPALNAGFAELVRDAQARGIATSRIIACVMDADGRLSRRALDGVLPLFRDSRVGGVQLPVRIRNRNSLLTKLQDVEFYGAGIAQLGRTISGTVSLGGNGQFTRLSALLELQRAPWQRSLTEDLDLALALLANGWRLATTQHAHVSQQGVASVKKLVRQRARWFQGHMECGRWLRELWSSRSLSHLGLLEVTMYLAVPWALVLPWSVAFNVSLGMMIEEWVRGGTSGALGTGDVQVAITMVLWYVFSFLPNWLLGYLYYRQNRRGGLLRAVVLGHLLLLTTYIAYAACWRALYGVLTGRRFWDKTARDVERSAALPAQALPVEASLPVLAQPVVRPAAAASSVRPLVPAVADAASGGLSPRVMAWSWGPGMADDEPMTRSQRRSCGAGNWADRHATRELAPVGASGGGSSRGRHAGSHRASRRRP